MAGIKLGEFRGTRPRLSKRLLDAREAQTALNVRLGSGELRPLRGLTPEATWVKTGPIRSLFAYDHPSLGRLWMHWAGLVDVVPGPNHNDTIYRVYYTGDGVPKMTFTTIIDVPNVDEPAGAFPRGWRRLGVPVPPAMTSETEGVTIEFTEPSTGGTITSITGPTEFENTQSQAYWNGDSIFAPTSFGWRSTAGWPPAKVDMDVRVGDEFLIEVTSPTMVRISGHRRDDLVPFQAIIPHDPSVGGYDTSLGPLYGSWVGRRNPDGTPLDSASGTFMRLRPMPGSRITFPEPHGLRTGEVMRITEMETKPQATTVELFGDINGSIADPQYWTSTTELTYTGELRFEVIRDGSVEQGELENRSYTYTYVTDLGEEGPPADSTPVVTIATGDGVRLSGFHIPDFPNTVIEYIRIYRSDSNDTNAEFRFVAEIPVADIVDYTPPAPELFEYGGTAWYDPQPFMLSHTTQNEIQANRPEGTEFKTAGSTITLTADIRDIHHVWPPTTTPTDFIAPQWTLQFQYSTNGTIWTSIGAPLTATGTAQNYTEDQDPLNHTYHGGIYLDERVSVVFDAAAAALAPGTLFFTRVLVNRVTGSHHTPRILRFDTYEEPAIPPDTDTSTEYSYWDTLKSFQLGEVIESASWYPPHEDMHSIATMPNGMLIGAYGRTVVFCEPYLPHAWPPEYERTIDYDVVGIGVFGNSALVCTTGTPYVFTGTHPNNMSDRRIEVKQACVAKESIANVGVGVLYATPDGLAFASMQGFNLITAGYFSREEWQALNPESMIGFAHDEQYVCFYDGGCFIFDPQRPEIGLSFTNDVGLTGGFEDLLTDTLYLSDGQQRLSWDTGAARTYKWRSKVFGMEYPINPAVARVLADQYPVTFRMYGDGQLRHERQVTSKEAFRLPSGYMANAFEVELEGSTRLMNVWIGETFTEVMEG